MIPFISYLVTCHNEGAQLRTLLSLLLKYSDGNQIVVLDDYSTDPITLEVLHEYQSVVGVKLVAHHLNKDYGAHKTYGTRQCDGEYVFQIDADELPNEILLVNLYTLLKSNPSCEMFWVPRVNAFYGVTQEDVRNYGWRVDDKGRINWPDYQSRIYKNLPNIKWDRKLHETIVGFKEFTRIPAMEELSLFHNKTIKKQREDNKRYISEFSTEDNYRAT
jgi:glycosyltransferase involved in cell wall biosynthesis